MNSPAVIAILQPIANWIWSLGVWISFFPAPAQIMPVAQYNQPPAGVDTSRVMQSIQIAEWDFVDNAYAVDKDPVTGKDVAGPGRPIQYVKNVSEMLDQKSAQLKARPKGKSVLWEWHVAGSGWINPRSTVLYNDLDGCRDAAGKFVMYTDFNGRVRPRIFPQFDNGVINGYAKWSYLMSELKKRGTPIDFFSTENETGISNWTLTPEDFQCIQNDPRFPALATELGFNDIVKNVGQYWTVPNGGDFVLKFNQVLGDRVNKAYRDSMYKAILENYPNLALVQDPRYPNMLAKGGLSDYAKFRISTPCPDGSSCQVWDINSWDFTKFPLTPGILKTHGTDLNYLSMGQLADRGLADGPFPKTPWNTLLLAINQARGIKVSNPNDQFWPFIGPYVWEGRHPFYKEFLIHLYLLGATGFIYWDPTNPSNPEDYSALVDTLKATDIYAGFADRKTLETGLINWRATSFQTCCLANKQKVCRVTNQDATGYWLVNGTKI